MDRDKNEEEEEKNVACDKTSKKKKIDLKLE